MATKKTTELDKALKHVLSKANVNVLPKQNAIYMPILKGKKGEFDALKELTFEDKSKILPLIEVPELGWDYVREVATTTLDKHLEKSAKGIAGAWIENYKIIIDCNLLDDFVSPGLPTIQYLFSKLATYKMNAIPSVLLDSSDAVLQSISQLVLNGSWVCIRVKASTISDFDVNNEIDRIIQTVNVSMDKVILLLDMEYFDFNQLGSAQIVSTTLIKNIRDIKDFGMFFLSITSFPINLSGISGNSIAEIYRIETSLYDFLDAKSNTLPRMPMYSDYCISNPQVDDVDPRIMTMSASIRYTTPKYWLIFKGRAIKTHSFDQFYSLSSQVVERPEYSGEEFSWVMVRYMKNHKIMAGQEALQHGDKLQQTII
jgi:hypothetical protein